jgi:hypothetical protein
VRMSCARSFSGASSLLRRDHHVDLVPAPGAASAGFPRRIRWLPDQARPTVPLRVSPAPGAWTSSRPLGRLIGRRSGAVPLFRETEPEPAPVDAVPSPEPKVWMTLSARFVTASAQSEIRLAGPICPGRLSEWSSWRRLSG